MDNPNEGQLRANSGRSLSVAIRTIQDHHDEKQDRESCEIAVLAGRFEPDPNYSS